MSDREIDEALALGVRCPTCDAEAGSYCRYPSTVDGVGAHKDRIRLALARARRQQRQGRERVAAVALLALAPLLVGFFLMSSPDPRFRSLLGGALFVELGLVFLWVALSPSARRANRDMGTFLGRHPRLAMVFMLVLGGGLVGIGGPDVIDWTAQPDTVTTVVVNVTTSGRGAARTTIHTTTGAHDVAWFWRPSVDLGPARLTLGHFSGKVLLVEQPVPSSP